MLITTLLACAVISAMTPIEAPALDDTSFRHPQSDLISCLDCGAKLNLSSEVIERLKEELKEREGFTVRGHTLRVTGYCRGCTHSRETRPQDDLSLSLLLLRVRSLPLSVSRTVAA